MNFAITSWSFIIAICTSSCLELTLSGIASFVTKNPLSFLSTIKGKILSTVLSRCWYLLPMFVWWLQTWLYHHIWYFNVIPWCLTRYPMPSPSSSPTFDQTKVLHHDKLMLHPNLQSAIPSLTSQNPREEMFSIYISILIVTSTSHVSRILTSKYTKEFKLHIRTHPVVVIVASWQCHRHTLH